MEKRMIHKAVVYICQILVMQLNDFSNKNLRTNNQFSFHHCKLFYLGNMRLQLEVLPVPASQQYPFSLPVGNKLLAKLHSNKTEKNNSRSEQDDFNIQCLNTIMMPVVSI